MLGGKMPEGRDKERWFMAYESFQKEVISNLSPKILLIFQKVENHKST